MSIKKQPQAIRAILFDLGNVILDFDFTPAYDRLCKNSSSKLTPRKIRDYFMKTGLELLLDSGKINSLYFYRKVRKDLCLSLGYPEFKALWNHIFKPNPAIVRLIRTLSTKEYYRLVLISNTNELHYKHIIKTYPLFHLFDALIISYQEKIRKPDERIYKKALKACRATPGQVVYIDDREDFTAAARDLGFRVFTFKKNPNELIAFLNDCGVQGVTSHEKSI